MAAFVNNPIANIQVIKKTDKKFNHFFTNLLNFKIITLFLILTILIEAIIGIRLLTAPIVSTDAQAMTNGRISLVTSRKEFKVGEVVPVNVRVSTGGHTSDGIDVIVKFDPDFFDLSDKNGVENGDLFTDFSSKISDEDKKVIQLSGINAADFLGYNGSDDFATLNLVTKKVGQTTIEVDYSPGATSDSNILESRSSRDLLEKVFNLELNIDQNEHNSLITKNAQSCEGFTQKCINDDGLSGVQQCEGGKKLADVCVWDPDLTSFCGPCEIE